MREQEQACAFCGRVHRNTTPNMCAFKAKVILARAASEAKNWQEVLDEAKAGKFDLDAEAKAHLTEIRTERCRQRRRRLREAGLL